MKQLVFVIAIAIALNAQSAEAQQRSEAPQHAPGWEALENSVNTNNQNSLHQRGAEFCWLRFGVLPGFPFQLVDQDFNRLPQANQEQAQSRNPARLPSASEAWVQNQTRPTQQIAPQPQRLHQPGSIEQTQTTTTGQLPAANETWAQTRVEPTQQIQPQDQRLNRATATTQLQTQQAIRFQQGAGQLEIPSEIIINGPPTRHQTSEIVQHQQRREDIHSRPVTDDVVVGGSSPSLQRPRPISQDAMVVEQESSEFPQTEILLSETDGHRILKGQHLIQQEEESRVSELVTDSALSSSAATAVQRRTRRQSQGSKTTLATRDTQRTSRVVRRVRNQRNQRTGSAFLSWVPWWLLPIAAWYGFKWWSGRRQTSAAEARLENTSRQDQRVSRSRNATAKTKSQIGPVPFPSNHEQSIEPVVSTRNNLVETDSTIQTGTKTTERQTINKERLTAGQTVTVHSRSEDPRTEDINDVRSQETLSITRETEGESTRQANEILTTSRQIETEPASADSDRSEVAQIFREPTDESIRHELGSRITANQSPEAESRRSSRDDRFDWTTIEGVDAKIQESLYQRGYNRFEDLQQLEPGKLRSEIAACGLRMDQSDCQRWIERASQAFSIRSQDTRDQSESQRTDSVIANELTRREQRTRSDHSVQSESGSISNGIRRQADDLTRIKGIGPATVKLLNQSGIHSFADLCGQNLGQLQQILHAGGENFHSIDPVSWHAQATHASLGEWEVLELWEKDKGESNTAQVESSRLEEPLSFNTSSEDLTQIKGIGPATQQRLNDAGVFSLSQIANMDSQRIAGILGDQDGQFNLVDPETWARQARELIGNGSDIGGDSRVVSEIRELEELADEVADLAKDLSREETLESAVDR